MAVRGLTIWSKSTQASQAVATSRNAKSSQARQIYHNRKATHRDEVENAGAVVARFGPSKCVSTASVPRKRDLSAADDWTSIPPTRILAEGFGKETYGFLGIVESALWRPE